MQGAPKGNQFWKLRSKHGRDKIFETPEIFLKAAYEYFETVNKNPWIMQEMVRGGDKAGEMVDKKIPRPYTIKGLCVFLNINHVTFLDYEREKGKDFTKVFTHVREIIETNQTEGAMVGAYKENIIARILGLADKQSIDIDDKRKSIEELFPPVEELKKHAKTNKP